MKKSGATSILQNITRKVPVFKLNGISTKRPVNILVYAENSKGRSAKVTVAEEIKMPHKQRQSKGDL